MPQLLKFEDYRAFLKRTVEENQAQRGYQASLARAAQCQPSYMSQVLSGKAELHPDQAAGLAEYFAFSELETDYFLTLVMLGRAATPRLKKQLSKKLSLLLASHEKLENRIEGSTAVAGEVEAFYYSSWIWSAIHIATSVPELQTPTAIAKRLSLPLANVKRCLEKLKKYGLVKNTRDGWHYAGGAGHLPAESVMTELNHRNWRARALLDLEREPDISLHYTSVVSLSSDDLAKLREFFIHMIAQSRKISDPSQPEDVVCVAFDFFRL